MFLSFCFRVFAFSSGKKRNYFVSLSLWLPPSISFPSGRCEKEQAEEKKEEKQAKKRQKDSTSPHLLRSVSIRSTSLPVCLARSLNSSSLVRRISLR